MSGPERSAPRRSASFSSLGAERRAAALVDPGSLCALTETGDPKTLWIGAGCVGGRRVLLALTDGRHRGGTVGVAEARVFTRLISAAAERRPAAVVVCWDTGGVRVHDGPPALAAASAVGIGLTRLSMLGTPVAAVIGGPRGCFGAPSVIAAGSQTVIVTTGAHWGLTGPKLLETASGAVAEATGRAATSARHRHRAGLADTLVADRPAAVRDAVARFLAAPSRRVSPLALLDDCAARTRRISARLAAQRPAAAPRGDGDRKRRRDFFQYSFRGHWRPTGPFLRRAHVRAAWGELDGRPAMGIILGPERPQRGIGVEDAQAVAEMVRFAVRESWAAPAPIAMFLFCRGHSNDLYEERAGLPCALAECLRSLLVARLLGHPLLCMLGGGAYGAAYLSLAAPSHRILAIRGTSVAPMAPRVLAAFERLRGVRDAPETPPDLAHFIPEIRIVENIVHLPRVLHEELAAARAEAHPEVKRSSRLAARPHPRR
jgi:malonate decarboxylase beta subunit